MSRLTPGTGAPPQPRGNDLARRVVLLIAALTLGWLALQAVQSERARAQIGLFGYTNTSVAAVGKDSVLVFGHVTPADFVGVAVPRDDDTLLTINGGRPRRRAGTRRSNRSGPLGTRCC